MTRLQAVGVLLVALGLIYALLYVAWLRKRRRHASAAIAAERERTREGAVTGGGDNAKAAGAKAAGAASSPAQLSVEGTYVSTTTAVSRLERVTVEGLGNRAKATLLITRGNPDELIRIERQGESTVLITGPRLVSVRRDRGMVGKFVGSNRLLVLQWRADDDALYETGFLPRYKADLDRVESTLWWHTGEDRGATGSPAASGVTADDTAADATGDTRTPETDSPATEGSSPS